jgi:beta-mannosidase
MGGRFNSEFGMEAFPHLETIEYFVEDKSELFPQSHTLDFHNKAAGHERRLATYLAENVRMMTDLEVKFFFLGGRLFTSDDSNPKFTKSLLIGDMV